MREESFLLVKTFPESFAVQRKLFWHFFIFFFIIVGCKCLRSNFKGALRRQPSTLDVMQMFAAVAKRIKLGPRQSDYPPSRKKKENSSSYRGKK